MALSEQKPKIKINKTNPQGRHTKSPVTITKTKTSGVIDLNSKLKISKTRLTGRHTKSPVKIKRSVPFAGGISEI